MILDKDTFMIVSVGDLCHALDLHHRVDILCKRHPYTTAMQPPCLVVVWSTVDPSQASVLRSWTRRATWGRRRWGQARWIETEKGAPSG
jgi:hypothetical protein